MAFTETEVVEVRLWYGKCAYGERNDINTDYLLKFLGTEATWVEGQIVSFAAVIWVVTQMPLFSVCMWLGPLPSVR